MIRAKKAREQSLGFKEVLITRKDLSSYIAVAQKNIEESIERGYRYAYVPIPNHASNSINRTDGAFYKSLEDSLIKYFSKYGYQVEVNTEGKNYLLVLGW